MTDTTSTRPQMGDEELRELSASSNCPVCDWNTPHAHDPRYDESKYQPHIDGARRAFERDMRDALSYRAKSKQRCTALGWDFDGRAARNFDSAFGYGWSARESYQGAYRYDFVEQAWQDWKRGWLASRASLPPPPVQSTGEDESLRKRIAELEALVHVPGAWRCPKCQFTLFQRTLHANDLSVSVRDEAGEKCPNCETPLWRVTERQERTEAIESNNRLGLENASLRNSAASTPAQSGPAPVVADEPDLDDPSDPEWQDHYPQCPLCGEEIEFRCKKCGTRTVSERELLENLAKELDHRAPAAKSREAREAIQSVKHGIEDVLSASPQPDRESEREVAKSLTEQIELLAPIQQDLTPSSAAVQIACARHQMNRAVGILTSSTRPQATEGE